MSSKVIDQYGRTFKKLRVSLTNMCNLACVYCTEDTKQPPIYAQKSPLAAEELANLVRILHQSLDLSSIRITGGEPLLYADIEKFINHISALHLPIQITTNGILLKSFLNTIESNLIAGINISLDALDETVFAQMSKRNALKKIIDGIDAAIKATVKVKINTVVLKGINEHQILPLLNFAIDKGISIRFLELMKMGHLFSNKFEELFFSQSQILEVIKKQYNILPLKRDPNATAAYWKLENGYKFGIIANESAPFCADCDRLRIDSFGRLFGCLSNSKHIEWDKNMPSNELNTLLRNCLAQKQTHGFVGSNLSMLHIGG